MFHFLQLNTKKTFEEEKSISYFKYIFNNRSVDNDLFILVWLYLQMVFHQNLLI